MIRSLSILFLIQFAVARGICGRRADSGSCDRHRIATRAVHRGEPHRSPCRQSRIAIASPGSAEVVIKHDKPWEGSGSVYHSIFKDGDLYRM